MERTIDKLLTTKITRRDLLASSIAAAGGLISLACESGNNSQDPKEGINEDFANQIAIIINRARTALRLEPLAQNQLTKNITSQFAQEWAEKDWPNPVTVAEESFGKRVRGVLKSDQQLIAGLNFAKINRPADPSNIYQTHSQDNSFRANLANPLYNQVGISVYFTKKDIRSVVFFARFLDQPQP